MKQELAEWTEELKSSRKLQERELVRDRIRDKDLPNEREQLQAAETEAATAQRSYEAVSWRLDWIRLVAHSICSETPSRNNAQK